MPSTYRASWTSKYAIFNLADQKLEYRRKHCRQQRKGLKFLRA